MFGAARSTFPELVDFLLLPKFSLMAFASSVEPLRAANQLAGRELYYWRTLSADGGPVTASNGGRILPFASLADAATDGALFVCAGIDAERFHDPSVSRALRAQARKGGIVGGVCTGSIALARAGLLDGYRCTIHWENVEGFAEEFPDLNITATLFEVDRNRCTCSGGTAPLDMMINAIAQDHTDALALSVAELLLHHAVRHPHDTQRIPIQHRTGITHPKLLAVIAQMEAYVESPVSLSDLAAAVNLSNRQLERLFRERLGKTPSRYYLELRLNRARLLLQQTTMSILQVAVACGFSSASHFARCYRELFNNSPRMERRAKETGPRLAVAAPGKPRWPIG